jgi:hypothetical protein
MNADDMPPEQAIWAYSSMLYDSRQERDSLRRELNIIINQMTDLQTDYQRLARDYQRIASAVFCPDCTEKMVNNEQL